MRNHRRQCPGQPCAGAHGRTGYCMKYLGSGDFAEVLRVKTSLRGPYLRVKMGVKAARGSLRASISPGCIRSLR